MNVSIWAGNRADERLLAIAHALRHQLLRSGRAGSAAIATGFTALGWPIDLAVFGPRSLTVVGAVDADGPVIASRTGPWTFRGEPQPPEGCNPYLSLRVARLALVEWLRDRTPASLGAAADDVGWDHATGRLVIVPAIAAGSQIAIGGDARTCRIVGLERLGPEVLAAPQHGPALSDDLLTRLMQHGLGLEPEGEPVAESPGCFLCGPADERCDLERVRGVVTHVRRITENSAIIDLKTEHHWSIPIFLNRPWRVLAEGIARLVAENAAPVLVAHHVVLRVSNNRPSLATTNGSLVVVAPEVALDVSSVATMADCPMAYVIQQFDPKSPNDATVRGKVVHLALRKVMRGASPEEALTDSIDESSLDLAYAGIDRAPFAGSVLPHVARLPNLIPAPGGRTETAVTNSALGLTGRTDATWDEHGQVTRILELKTGTPTPWGRERPEHALQALLYATMLWQTGRLDRASASVDVGYTGGQEPVLASIAVDWRRIRHAVLVRDLAVLFDLTGESTGSPLSCQPCRPFRRERCHFYADLLGYQPDILTEDDDRRTFRFWVRLLRKDAAITARAAADAARKSLRERIAEGTAIRIIRIENESLDREGRWHARLVYRSQPRFRVGDRLRLSEDDPAGRQTIAEIERMASGEILVASDDPAPWATQAEINASNLPLQGLFQGLTGWYLAEPRLRRLVAGDRPPTFRPLPPPDPELDIYQQHAAQGALAADDYYLIWGPPGTGKTRTIARIVRAAVAEGRRVAVTAFTNQAVDNLALALLNQEVHDFVLLGRPSRSIQQLDAHTLERFGSDSAAVAHALHDSPIVLSTAHSIATGRYDRAFGGAFDLVIVDEATQLSEPAALGVIRLSKAFVLVGDHRQLSPIVADPDSPLGRSLFDRLWDMPAAATARAMLARQYRMREAIAAYPAEHYYEGRLETAPEAEARPPVTPPESRWPGIWNPALPAVLVDCGSDAAEVDVTAALAVEALADGLNAEQVGVVAPYRQQVGAIANVLRERCGNGAPIVDTVDRFQGSERDVIVLATGAGRRGELLSDERRLNVALTRARRKLIIVGDVAKLDRIPATAPLVAHFRDAGALVTLPLEPQPKHKR